MRSSAEGPSPLRCEIYRKAVKPPAGLEGPNARRPPGTTGSGRRPEPASCFDLTGGIDFPD